MNVYIALLLAACASNAWAATNIPEGTLLVAVMGASDAGNLAEVDVLSLSSGMVNAVTFPAPQAKKSFASTIVNGTIYTLGGIDIGYSNKLLAYDVADNKWTKTLPELHNQYLGRYGGCLVALNDNMYALGGTSMDTGITEAFGRYINFVYKYDIAKAEWSQLSNGKLPSKDTYACAAVLNKSIYYITRHGAYRTDDEAVSWVKLDDMKEKRKNAVCVAVGSDAILVAGGVKKQVFGTEKTLSSVELYNVTTNAWQSVSPMNVARYSAGAVRLPGTNNVVVCGGRDDTFTGSTFFKSCEQYDWSTNQWTTTPYSMNKPRGNFGLFVVEQKPKSGGAAEQPAKAAEPSSKSVDQPKAAVQPKEDVVRTAL